MDVAQKPPSSIGDICRQIYNNNNANLLDQNHETFDTAPADEKTTTELSDIPKTDSLLIDCNENKTTACGNIAAEIMPEAEKTKQDEENATECNGNEENKQDEEEEEKEICSAFNALLDHNYVNNTEHTISGNLNRLIIDHIKLKNVKSEHEYEYEESEHTKLTEFVNRVTFEIDNFEVEVAQEIVYKNCKKLKLDFEKHVQNVIDSVAANEESQYSYNIDVVKKEKEEVEAEAEEMHEKFPNDEQRDMLEKLTNFAQNLLESSKSLQECKDNFDSEKFENYLSIKFKEFKALNCWQKQCIDSSVQTDLNYKSRHLHKEKKLHKKHRRENSTSSESDSDSSSSSSSSSSSTSTSSSSSSISSLGSNRSKEQKKVTKIKRERNENEIKASDSSKNEEDDEDKEIDRLINIDGLLKRGKYKGSNQAAGKTADEIRQKAKLSVKDKLLDYSCSEESESENNLDDVADEHTDHSFKEVTMAKDLNGQVSMCPKRRLKKKPRRQIISI